MAIVRRLIKSSLEGVASLFAASGFRRGFAARGGRLVLAWHNVVPHGERQCGERSLHMPWQDFLDQLSVLETEAEIVPLSRIRDPGVSARRKPLVALTFDDAYSGAVSAAIPELVRRKLPATMFVAPGILDRKPFWWDSLASAETGFLEPGLREHALTVLRGDGEQVINWASTLRLPIQTLPEHSLGASAQSVRQITWTDSIELGAHSWSHANLAALIPSALADELKRPMDWIRESGVIRPVTISYPYGSHSREVDLAATAVGYSAAFRVDGGWIAEGRVSDFVLPRFNVPAGLSIAGLQARLGGWWPLR